MKPLEAASLFSPLSPTCQCYWDLLGCSQLHCQCFPKGLHCMVWDPLVQAYLQCGHLHLNGMSAKAHREEQTVAKMKTSAAHPQFVCFPPTTTTSVFLLAEIFAPEQLAQTAVENGEGKLRMNSSYIYTHTHNTSSQTNTHIGKAHYTEIQQLLDSLVLVCKIGSLVYKAAVFCLWFKINISLISHFLQMKTFNLL